MVQNDTAVLYTVHVGLYNSGEGIVFCVFKVLCLEKLVYSTYSPSTGHIQLSGGMTSTLVSDSRFTLTCISTGGPATTVTWTRYTHIFTTGNETVLDNPVTAQYTHTLTLTGRGTGRYRCAVANKVSPFSSAELFVRGKKTECDTFYS